MTFPLRFPEVPACTAALGTTSASLTRPINARNGVQEPRITNAPANRHPSLVYYGEHTLARTFPLLLVIGREPQVDEIVSPGVGPYDFAAHPRCAFWNVAHSMLARSDRRPEFGPAALKKEFMRRGASPIAFADALPICLSNKNDGRSKCLQRAEVLERSIDEHVAGIFALDIMQRVDLVVLAGHQLWPFRYAANILRGHLKRAGKTYIETAFFYPTNSRTIEARIDEAHGWAALRTILTAFRAA